VLHDNGTSYQTLTLMLNRTLTVSQVTELTDKFINQNILDTQYIRDLREEAKDWP